MAIMRWDRVNPGAVRIGRVLANTTFLVPLHVMRKRFTSRVQVLIERQAAVVDRDRVTSKLIAVDPLRMNTALFGLQFVH
jgi:hypothetical protein